MKYFVIADIHGFYDEMREALDNAGFSPDNESHMLISLGDIVDRGPKPVEVLEYLMGLPRKILIKGNHEDLAEEMMRSGTYGGHDISNGTWDTFRIFAAHERGHDISPTLAIFDWDSVNMYVKHYSLWRKYLREVVNYYETERHVFVHGWIPVDFGYEGTEVMQNWRQADEEDWESARWAKSPQYAKRGLLDPAGKTIVCGHWHASDFHRVFGAEESDTPYFGNGFIACDACTARSGFCNVVVIDDDIEN